MSSPAGEVMEILGHRQIALTMNTYSHVAPEVSREAADRMARALWHDEDQRMTTVAARVAARPVTGTPKPSPGVALTWEFTGAPPGTRTPRIKSPLLRSSIHPAYQHIYAIRWQDIRNPPRRSTVFGRALPRSTGTSEPTRSKHGTHMV